jgi:hypothetical protein
MQTQARPNTLLIAEGWTFQENKEITKKKREGKGTAVNEGLLCPPARSKIRLVGMTSGSSPVADRKALICTQHSSPIRTRSLLVERGPVSNPVKVRFNLGKDWNFRKTGFS